MKKKSNIYMLCFFFVFVSVVGYSQKIPPTPAGLPPNPGLPINGGIVYLVISGIIYGVYELKKKK